MTPDTAGWMARTPVEALLCRDLRHAWPRPAVQPAGRRRTGAPPSSPNIAWKTLATGSATARRVLQRTMVCTAGCGVRRVEVFVVRDERLVRTGTPKLLYPSWYKRTRAQPDEPLEALDVDVLRGNIVQRLYPGVQW